ncbi:MAG: phosphate ABC transporter substrate-binding protein PstS [Caldivirga sp.]|uniref:phosphate ABC transporter substrate-binding protein PstS n=1 Tax=Caldivirga sp. TaxID=2080243 RepID=UPI003D13373D
MAIVIASLSYMLLKGYVLHKVVNTSTVSLNIAATIKAGGSTWINPQMQVWVRNFTSMYSGISITYDSVGSGTGVTRFLQGVYDIAASDVPMPTQLYMNATSKYGKIITIPDSIGAVAFIYNIPGFTGTLNLTADVIAGIYLGKIRYWDDPAITSLNKGFKFPHEPIIAVHRSDGSGTTFTLTLWLYKSSEEWKNSGVGYGYVVNWPIDQMGTGLGGKGSEGVTAYVKQNQWSIGYVELSYAIVNNLSVAAVQNPVTGEFVKPSYSTTLNALNAVNLTGLPSVTENWYPYAGVFMNMNAHAAYPIVGATYLHFPADYMDCNKAVAIYLFIKYILTKGQGELIEGYIPLPSSLAQRLVSEVGNSMVCNGKPVSSMIK